MNDNAKPDHDSGNDHVHFKTGVLTHSLRPRGREHFGGYRKIRKERGQ